MNIVKSRGGMAAILASLALASASAFAQAPGGGPPGGGPPGGGRGGGFGGPQTKETVMQRQGLTMAELKLTPAQTASLEKLAEKMAADQTALTAKYPQAQGGPPSAEMQAERTKLTEAFTAEVNKVLNDEQKKTWAARPQGGRGGGGPPGGGGGMGGPPGGGPPGGAPGGF
jgi:hypothetical protein